MTGKTHLLGGVMASLGIITAVKGNMNYVDMATCIACCELGSLLPDIDTTSKITEEDILFKAISIGLKSLGVKHRGITHTIWACAIFGILSAIIAKIMIGLINSSAAFLLACIVFILIHTDNSVYGIKKFGSVIALGVYFGIPIIMNFLPIGTLESIPTVKITISPIIVGISVFFGCLSHLLYDTCNPQGVAYIQPISKKRISILPITTSSGLEIVFAGIMSTLIVVWVVVLFYVGYIKLPY